MAKKIVSRFKDEGLLDRSIQINIWSDGDDSDETGAGDDNIRFFFTKGTVESTLVINPTLAFLSFEVRERRGSRELFRNMKVIAMIPGPIEPRDEVVATIVWFLKAVYPG
jgi:hypothetical protein